ncbi:hypothetical protein ACH5RR_023153 [Cinchona calisaya]|uniref:Retrovirus-related Pol polyprotein from transposon TNT 1-94 n=1 Tax=Cinchona calisaya TaxID=153742 RepID=A0ABD2ZBQ4_9GENT
MLLNSDAAASLLSTKQDLGFWQETDMWFVLIIFSGLHGLFPQRPLIFVKPYKSCLYFVTVVSEPDYWLIIEYEVGEPVEGKVLTDAQKMELDAKKLKDLKEKNYLFQAIDRPILETILCEETSRSIWDSMKKKYQAYARVKRAQLQALRKDFETLQMKDGESVTSYYGRTMEISNKMRVHGEKIEDVTIVEKILHSLIPKFNHVVCSIEESKDIDSLSADELQSTLLVHE